MLDPIPILLCIRVQRANSGTTVRMAIWLLALNKNEKLDPLYALFPAGSISWKKYRFLFGSCLTRGYFHTFYQMIQVRKRMHFFTQYRLVHVL